MRIDEDVDYPSVTYSDEVRQRAADMLLTASRISELTKLISEIRESAGSLRELFLSEEDLENRRGTAGSFDSDMQTDVMSTTVNLTSYLQGGWKELLCKGANENG